MLANSYSKINRAKGIIKELELKLEKLNIQRSYILKNEYDENTKENILVYYPTEKISLEIPVMIGEVVQHLRSALDLAIYDLTLINTGSELEKTEFPIFDNKEFFLLRKKNNDPAVGSGLFKMRGIKKSSQEIIEKIQPYNLNTSGSHSILSLVHHLNILDKHKTLFLCRRLSKKTKLIIIKDAFNLIHFSMEIGANLDEKAIIGRLLLNEPDGEHYLDAEIEIELYFSLENYKYFKKPESVLKTLETMVIGVSKVLYLLENSVK